jgi:hypothetical protein
LVESVLFQIDPHPAQKEPTKEQGMAKKLAKSKTPTKARAARRNDVRPDAPVQPIKIAGREIATPVDVETVIPEGWSVRTFELSTGRAAEDTLADLPLEPGDVVEFELQGGQRILVAAEDVPDYFRGASRAIDGTGGGEGAIVIGATLTPPGADFAEASRDGLGAWFIKGLKIIRRGPAAVAAITVAGTLQDALLGQRHGVYRVRMDDWDLTPANAIPPSEQRILVLLHGTISSAQGSFGKLWAQGRQAALAEEFQGGVYALEHRTLTDSPVKNALMLVEKLPAGARLTLLSHSRGGLVGELIARANRNRADAFTEDDIAQLKESAAAAGIPGYDEIADDLVELNRQLKKKAVTVERFVRVACPARGTTLLADKLDRWASVMVNLLNLGIKGISSATMGTTWPASVSKAAFSFFASVVRERADARTLPGLEAMRPDSPLIAMLNRDDATLKGNLYVIAGDFVGDGVLKTLGDGLAERFFAGHTDLVVNTDSMAGGASRVEDIRFRLFDEPGHHHLNYFEKSDSADVIMAALRGKDDGFKRVAPSRVFIGRGGEKPTSRPDAPILFMLPGIMGSGIEKNGKRIWLEILQIMSGKIADTNVDAQGNIGPSGWIDQFYEELKLHMQDTHEIWPFPYDWRLSIADAAEKFGKKLDDALIEGKRRGKPVRILAHSMGGLVARLAMSSGNRWDKFKALPGARFVQLGTPNGGSASIAQVLLGRDPFVRSITKLDLHHDMREFLDIVSKYPGVLELMPNIPIPGLSDPEIDYFDAQNWRKWAAVDEASKKGLNWVEPLGAALDKAKKVTDAIRKAPIDKDVTLYVAGCAPETPIAVRVTSDNRIEIGITTEGDGRVPWSTGIPKDVKTWYVEAVHGDLPSTADAFNGYRQLLEMGQTPLLSQQPVGTRGAVKIRYREVAELEPLQPTAEELAAAAMGGTPPSLKQRKAKAKKKAATEILVVQGSLTTSDNPVMIGTYAHDYLMGTTKVVDEKMHGRLSDAKLDGIFPNNPGEALLVLQRDPKMRPRGAIVAGLGPLGVSTPGDLTLAYQQGLMRYVNHLENEAVGEAGEEKQMEVATLLIGTGFGGLSIDVSARSLMEAVAHVAARLQQESRKVRLARLTVFERTQDRAILAAKAISACLREARFADVAKFTGHVVKGKGGYRALALTDSGLTGSRRIHINADSESRTLKFMLVTDRARNALEVEPSQRATIDSMLREATGSATDRPGLSRIMFELLVPNAFKAGIGDTGGLVLGLDYATAEYPWELLRDTSDKSVAPLCVRIGVVRQLTSERGSMKINRADNGRMLVIGDTDSGYADLPGAQHEAEVIRDIARRAGLAPDVRIKAKARDVWEMLFDGVGHSVIHLACHGKADLPPGAVTPPDGPRPLWENMGAVLAKDMLLTSSQIAKLPKVPEFVFLNCCHLGSMKGEIAMQESKQWSKLAANLGTQFIEMGCSAAIVAGWEVHDGAAELFAREFYEAMFAGERFTDAVKRARRAAYESFPHTNTWGAYQAYGDEGFRFPKALRGAGDDERKLQPAPFVHEAEALSALEHVRADAEVETDAKRQAELIARLEQLDKRVMAQYPASGAVRAELGVTYVELGLWERSISHNMAALTASDARVWLRAAELLADAENRQGKALADGEDAAERKRGKALLETAAQRLEGLLALGITEERLSLLAANYKRLVLLERDEDTDKQKGAAPSAKTLSMLERMTRQYGKARELSIKTKRRADYYATFNMLCGLWLLQKNKAKLHQELTEPAKNWEKLLVEIVEDSKARLAVEHDFFHALAPCEAAIVRWLWTYGTRSAAENAKIANEIVRNYVSVMQRFGSVREVDSVQTQQRFLLALTPPGAPEAKALEAFMAEMAKLAQPVKTGAQTVTETAANDETVVPAARSAARTRGATRAKPRSTAKSAPKTTRKPAAGPAPKTKTAKRKKR